MGSPLIHPRLLEELGTSGFYPSRCTIQSDTNPGQSASGEPLEGFEDVVGLSDIPCALGPSSGREIRMADGTVVTAEHRIALQGHFPQITEQMQVVVGGGTYNILRVLHDSQKSSSYLDVEQVR